MQHNKLWKVKHSSSQINEQLVDIVGHLSFEAEDKGEKQGEGGDVYSHRGHTETNCTFSGFDSHPCL